MAVMQTTAGCVLVFQGSDALKPHHLGHGAQIRIKIGVEGGVVVVDRTVRIFQTISGQYTDHCGSVWNLCGTLD